MSDTTSRSFMRMTGDLALAIVNELKDTVGDVSAGDVYRLVGDVDALATVAGCEDHFRGFAHAADGGISSHAQFFKVPLASLSPAVAWSVASAALGCYWQQQIDARLDAIESKLSALIDYIDKEKDAKLCVAEEEIRTLTALPIGAHMRSLPPAITNAVEILHGEAAWLCAQHIIVDQSQHGVPLAECLRLHDELFPRVRRFQRAFVVDSCMARLQLTSAERMGADDFRDVVLERADARRRMLHDVAAVLRPLSRAQLTDDRTGLGEHLLPMSHPARLVARREQARTRWRALGTVTATLDDLWRMTPDPSWCDRPYALEVTQTAAGELSATIVEA